MWRVIEEAVSRELGEPFHAVERRSVGGGCINEAYCLRGEHLSLFVKLNSAGRLAMFEAEAAGLEAILASDSIRAPRPVATGLAGEQSWLALEFVELTGDTALAGARLGEQLAAMHRCTADAFGWDRDNTIGTTPQPNTWSVDWVAFLRDRRIGYQLRLARDSGLPTAAADSVERLLDSLPAMFSTYTPQPSLLHGDLWGGNWAADQLNRPVLFDPAVYYGDRENDLAMTELFGGFNAAFYNAYRSAWPLDHGYSTRKRLYQLYHVLNHFNLFGGGYAVQARSLADSLLAEVG